MLSLEVARALQAGGVRWDPRPGDAFMIPDRDLDGEVFVLSEMVIESRPVAGGAPILAFNGTTEWALDSLDAQDAVWLPREDQLRTLLGGTFVGLERMDGDADGGPGGGVEGWAVTLRPPSGRPGEPTRFVDVTAEAAYARALLSLLG